MTRMLLLAALALACDPSFAMAGALGISTPERLYAYAVPFSVVFAIVACGLVLRAHFRGRVPPPDARIWLIPFAFMLTMLVGPAFAAEVATVGNTAVILPYGQWITALAQTATEILIPILITAVGIAARKLPWYVGMWFTTQRIDRMVKLAADYALNAVAGATADKALTVDVGYTVLKVALERALGSSPQWLIDAAGGTKGITERLFRAFKFDETVTDANTLVPLISDLPRLPFVAKAA